MMFFLRPIFRLWPLKVNWFHRVYLAKLSVGLMCFLVIFLGCNTSVWAKIDSIEVIKHQRIMRLIKDDKVYKIYKISLGKNPEGHKLKDGDNKTPEGTYEIIKKNQQSVFHLSLLLSYPNAHDQELAKKENRDPGKGIMIHGLPNYLKYLPEYAQKFHNLFDWTAGSIALTNEEIENVFEEVDVGTKVIIYM